MSKVLQHDAAIYQHAGSMTAPKYPKIRVKLVGQNGNAFNLIGIVRKALATHGVPLEDIDAFVTEATTSDYDNVLRTCMKWVDTH